VSAPAAASSKHVILSTGKKLSLSKIKNQCFNTPLKSGGEPGSNISCSFCPQKSPPLKIKPDPTPWVCPARIFSSEAKFLVPGSLIPEAGKSQKRVFGKLKSETFG
jgi:hypothetical protein